MHPEKTNMDDTQNHGLEIGDSRFRYCHDIGMLYVKFLECTWFYTFQMVVGNGISEPSTVVTPNNEVLKSHIFKRK